MKRFFRCAAAAVVTSCLLFLAASCDTGGGGSEDEFGYLFVNASDYAVTVQPNGQSSWSAFTLSAGGSKTVSIPESTIYFKYNQADYVRCDTSGAGKIRFVNRTLLGIRNSSTADLELVNWRGYYFGDDQVYDAALGKYVNGLKPGSLYVNEVSAGSGYVYFWFVAGGPKYRTASVVTVGSEAQLLFTFYGTTTVTTASLVVSPGRTGAKGAESFTIGIEQVPNSSGPERGADVEVYDGGKEARVDGGHRPAYTGVGTGEARAAAEGSCRDAGS